MLGAMSETVAWVGLAMSAAVAVAQAGATLGRANLREQFRHVETEIEHLRDAIEREERERKESVSGLGRRVGDAETQQGVTVNELVRLGGELKALDERVRELRVKLGSTPAMSAARPPFPSRPGG
jgi:chromosome segregation ATPase